MRRGRRYLECGDKTRLAWRCAEISVKNRTRPDVDAIAFATNLAQVAAMGASEAGGCVWVCLAVDGSCGRCLGGARMGISVWQAGCR